jgi:ankyrin repeat protein
MCAVACGAADAVHALLELQHSIDMGARDAFKYTALDLARLLGHATLVAVLLDAARKRARD